MVSYCKKSSKKSGTISSSRCSRSSIVESLIDGGEVNVIVVNLYISGGGLAGGVLNLVPQVGVVALI